MPENNKNRGASCAIVLATDKWGTFELVNPKHKDSASMQCSKFSVLNFLVCHGQNDMRLFISAVIFKNKIFVGEYSAKEAQHLFEN